MFWRGDSFTVSGTDVKRKLFCILEYLCEEASFSRISHERTFSEKKNACHVPEQLTAASELFSATKAVVKCFEERVEDSNVVHLYSENC